jgi:putative phosphoribosyl transferase
MIFRDRADAARLLAERLEAYRGQPAVLVLGLPRGGVPMARIVADALSAPVDILLVRKLGVPSQPELAFGAIAEDGVQVLDPIVIEECRVHPRDVERTIAREQQEIARRAILFRGAHRPPNVRGRDVIVVDDGLATGSTMLAAVRALRTQKPHRMVVAVPVGSGEACRRVQDAADEVVCLSTPEHFEAVGNWYCDFEQVTDDEVKAALTAPAVQP